MTDLVVGRTSFPRAFGEQTRCRGVVRGRGVARERRSVLVRPWVRLVVFARHLVPATLTLVLAGGFYIAGFFVDSVLTLPLMVVAVLVVATDTALGYRADIAQRSKVVAMRRDQLRRDEETALRHEEALRELDAVAAGALALAAVPALLTAQLQVLTPILGEISIAQSVGRRRVLLAQLELAAVEAACELVGVAHRGSYRAVLYRRSGRRFEPASSCGDWPAPPTSVGRTAPLASSLRRVLASPAPTHGAIQAWVDGRFAAQVPVRAGRCRFGVLCVERSGQPLRSNEIEAIVVVAHLLAAGAAAGRLALPATSAKTPRLQAEPLPSAPAALALPESQRIRTGLSAQLVSLVPTEPAGIAVT